MESPTPKGQNPTDMSALDSFPPTVVDTEEQVDGLTLVTLDPDPDKNLEVYDDGRAMHESGNPPGDDDG